MCRKELKENIYLNRGYILDGVFSNYYQVFKVFKSKKEVKDEDGQIIEDQNDELMVEDGENGFEKFMFHNLDSEEYELLKPISPSIVIEIKCNDSE